SATGRPYQAGCVARVSVPPTEGRAPPSLAPQYWRVVVHGPSRRLLKPSQRGSCEKSATRMSAGGAGAVGICGRERTTASAPAAATTAAASAGSLRRRGL